MSNPRFNRGGRRRACVIVTRRRLFLARTFPLHKVISATLSTRSPSSMSSPPPPTLRALVAACFSASVHGGRVIREVVQQGVALDVVNKAEGSYDPQTVADRRSQQRLIHALRQAYPLLQIVGEEGELAPPEAEDVVACDLHALDRVAFEGGEAAQQRALDWSDLVLWVDPLDGTKRFAAKKFDEVSVLIGVAYKQRPIAGVVHLPFHGEHGVTYWGGPEIGVFRSQHEASEAQTTHAKVAKPEPMFPRRPLLVTVSSTNCELVNHALRELSPERVLTGGATGTMVLGVLTGESDAFFRFKAATRKWDICAVEPLLEALGGKLADTQGRVYVYDPVANAPDFDNERGLVACLDSEALQMVLNAMARVTDMEFLPDSTHYGKHSTVAKLRVSFKDQDHQTTLFLKKSVRHELPPRSAAHWARDLASYRTEATFYAHFAARLQARGVAIVRPFAVFQSDASGRCSPNLVASPPSVAVESQATQPENFLLLLECLDDGDDSSPSTYEAADCLELEDTRQVLRYLAALHASAWGQPRLLAQAGAELWPAACWWAYPKRGELELAQAASVWPGVLRHFRSFFEAEDSGLPSMAELASLGQRMIQHAAYISASLSEAPRLQTLVHGDLKSANLFFETRSREVVAFDWQWSGLGLGALDVANLLNTSVSISLLSDDRDEQELLQFYHTCLTEKLRTLGMETSSYSFAAFERHYMLATLEYGRLLISNFWKDMTPTSCVAKAGKANCGLGYRSIPHVVRMVRKLHEGLRRVEREREQQ
ncbi:hypothetical protein BBJ28_00009497 [Nothophytophthora sp. Chile5]|nr:hypothetical protein BBJ28_00009497 [Nothophytophthora sp. Chile5]